MPTPPAILKPPTLWQADPKWASMKLGYSDRTIKSDGCLFMCHLALYQLALGRDVTPAELDAELKSRGKFEGPFRNYLRPWSSVKQTFGDVVRWHGSMPETKPPLTTPRWHALIDWLISDLNNFAFIKLDFDRLTAGNQNHFVLAYGIDGRGDILCIDPAFGVAGTLRADGGEMYYGRYRAVNQYGPATVQHPDTMAVWRYDLVAIQPPREI
jgi:hypothetical protein